MVLNINIDRVRSNREFLQFIRIPAELYADAPSYVAPLDREQYSLLHPRKSPFFSHGHASFWIARKGNTEVGRISAQIDSLASHQAGCRVGFFGCLDAVDDPLIVKALTDAAEGWLRTESCNYFRGPFKLSINGESGMLVAGQEHAPMIGMPWHPTYLGKLLESCGYEVAKVLRSYELSVNSLSSNFGVNRGSNDKIRVRSLRLDHFGDEAEACRTLFNDAWKHNWGFIPLSQSDMRALVDELKDFLIPDCAIVAEYEGRPIGFMLIIPNLFYAARGLGSAPNLLGWIRFIIRAKQFRYNSARVILFGIAPSIPIPIRASALMTMVAESINRIKQYSHVNIIEAGWVLDDNFPMIRILDYFEFSPIRTYHLYEKSDI